MPDPLKAYLEIQGRYLATGLFTHAYVAAGRLGERAPRLRHLESSDGRDVFDLASLTKALVTTPLVLNEVLRHEESLDGTVADWLGGSLPALAEPLRRLSIKSLLTHQSGLPAWRNFWTLCTGAKAGSGKDPIKSLLIERLNRAGEALRLDQGQVYSDVGFLLLGLVLEERAKAGLEEQFGRMWIRELAEDPVSWPLQYGPVIPDLAARAISTGVCRWRGRDLFGEVHDDNCAALGGISAHAGLFGTGDALVRYLTGFSRSELGEFVLRTNASHLKVPPGDPPNEALLGWRQGADPSSFPFANGNAMGHMGFTGVAFWVTPDGSYGILLTNRVISGRRRPGIAAFRREVFGLLGAVASA